VLRRYAERGLFREFDDRTGSGGRYEARFHWLLPDMMRVLVDPARRRLSCPDLLPGIAAKSPLRKALARFLAGRHHRDLPEHRRIDPLRSLIVCPVRAGRATLALDVHDGDWAYATGKLVNLVHEVYVHLHREWPEYAHQAFGTGME